MPKNFSEMWRGFFVTIGTTGTLTNDEYPKKRLTNKGCNVVADVVHENGVGLEHDAL